MELPPDISYEDYEQVLHIVCGINTATTWWIADALRFGERAFRDDVYAQAAAFTGLAPHTLETYASVANRVPPERRVEGLRFSHHQEVAPLEPADQSRWLESAELHAWTKEELRLEIRAERAERNGVPIPRELDLREAALAVWHASRRSVGNTYLTPAEPMLILRQALGE
jgi:hypothetical protein